jgi:chromosome segregation ATPase
VELIFEGHTLQTARRSLAVMQELFAALLTKPDEVRLRASERHLRLFPAAILDLQRQLAGQNRGLCQLAEANGRARADRDSQLEGLPRAIDEVAKKQRHERDEAVGKVWRQIECVAIKLSETEDAVGPRVGPMERAVLELADTKDRTSRVESDVAGLRAAIADKSAKLEEVRQEVAGLKAELSDCYPKGNQEIANLEQELARLNEEIRTMKPNPSLIAPPAVDVAVPPAPKAIAPTRKSSSS